jgi:hypothetical protein
MKSQRFVLSVGQAREIYGLKFLASTSGSAPGGVGQREEITYCVLLAARYGVSSKTIRDIWNRKTWASATKHLFDQEQVSPIDRSFVECLDSQVQSEYITSVSLVSPCISPNLLIADWAAVTTKQGWASQGIAEQTAQSKENGKSGAIIARVFSYP